MSLKENILGSNDLNLDELTIFYRWLRKKSLICIFNDIKTGWDVYEVFWEFIKS